MIYILTEAIRTGKTTALLNWATDRNDVDGLLCPDNEKGRRFFLKVKSKEKYKLEAESDTESIIKIGNFKFLKSAFNTANQDLIAMASDLKSKYLIIDELGKLELKNEGLHDSTKSLIHLYVHDKTHHLILVIRDYLLEAVLKHYTISKYSILKKEDLEKL